MQPTNTSCKTRDAGVLGHEEGRGLARQKAFCLWQLLIVVMLCDAWEVVGNRLLPTRELRLECGTSPSMQDRLYINSIERCFASKKISAQKKDDWALRRTVNVIGVGSPSLSWMENGSFVSASMPKSVHET